MQTKDLSRNPANLQCLLITAEATTRFSVSPAQTATAGPCRPHPLSQSNKFPFTTYIHSIRPVPLENPDQYSSFFKRPTSSLLFPKDAL